jgi:hypothetical protein
MVPDDAYFSALRPSLALRKANTIHETRGVVSLAGGIHVCALAPVKLRAAP